MRLEQALTRRYLVLMPILMTGTVASLTIEGIRRDEGQRALLLVAAALYATMLAITLAGNMALNVATLRTSPSAATMATWQGVRRRWDQLHAVRNALNLAGFVLVAIAVTR